MGHLKGAREDLRGKDDEVDDEEKGKRERGERRLVRVLVVVVGLAWGMGLGLEDLGAYPLTEAQQERLETYLPVTLRKLERQVPVHVALIGDEVAGMETMDERSGNVFESLHGYFLQGMEREFFYTGGVKWLNPGRGRAEKMHGHRGREITLETFTGEGATWMQVMQVLTTRVFLRPTDLVLVHVGLNDYRSGLPRVHFGQSILEAKELCLDQGAEMVLIGPAPLREGEDLQSWGGIRQVTGELRRAAEEAGVMFLDPALELMRTRPASGEVSLAERTQQLASALRMELLDYGAGKSETVLINARAHRRAGQGIFRQFLNGPPGTKLKVSGEAMRLDADRMRLELEVENPGGVREKGMIAPLRAGENWEPVVASEVIDLEPGGKATVVVEYRRKGEPGGTVGRGEGASVGRYCFPVLYSGLDETELCEWEGVPGPVSVRWDAVVLRGVEKQFPLSFTLVNPSAKAVRGNYEIEYERQRAKGSFLVEGHSEKSITAQTVLAGGGEQIRRKDPVILRITSGEVSFQEIGTLEMTRNLVLGEEIALGREDKLREGGTDGHAEGGVKMEVVADEESILVTFDLGERLLEEGPERPAIVVELTFDGRPGEERRELGFVSPLQLAFGAEPGGGWVGPIEPGSFGNFYGKILSEAGIRAEVRMKEDGNGRTMTVRVPRVYFYRHEWEVGRRESALGFGARLRFLKVDAVQGSYEYLASQTWVTATSEYGRWNSGSLAELELTREASPRWTVRLH